jgi:hypothetical protein
LLAQLSELLAQRQLHTEGAFANAGEPTAALQANRTRYAAGFVDKIRAFFEL